MTLTNREKAIEAAKKIIDEMGIIQPPVHVEKIAKQLNAQVRFSPLDNELSGMVYIKKETPIIGVNALHHPNRQRFTIAHEIGHLALHRDRISDEVHVDKKFPVLMRDANAATGVDSIEIEANAFAAELLMPEDLVKACLKDSSADIDDNKFITALAKKFKVSPQAIQLRLGQILK